jgi:heme/copper-type cytochrome/quinol oxidase subunit 3
MPRASTGKVLAFPRKSSAAVPQAASHGPPPPSSSINAIQLGVLLFIGSEVMLFAGLLAVYTAFRFGNLTWPSAQLYLPVKVTWVNTFFLLFSCYTMRRAVSAGRKNRQSPLVTYLTVTALLGALFLSIQGYEWIQLIRDGFTITTGVYGATFYLLIGCHALHVLGAVIWLLVVVRLARRGRFPSHRFVGVEVCAWYWYFVGGLWVLLFGLVYLN